MENRNATESRYNNIRLDKLKHFVKNNIKAQLIPRFSLILEVLFRVKINLLFLYNFDNSDLQLN